MLDGSRRRGGVNRIMMVRDGRMVGILEEGDTLMLLRVYPREVLAARWEAEWRILAKGQEATITVSRDARDSLRLVTQI
jgi:hypothetical protein